MVDKLTKLYNTMALIGTRGEDTKRMALCLNYLSQLIDECAVSAAKAASAPVESEE